MIVCVENQLSQEELRMYVATDQRCYRCAVEDDVVLCFNACLLSVLLCLPAAMSGCQLSCGSLTDRDAGCGLSRPKTAYDVLLDCDKV